MADVELDARVTVLEENGGGGGNEQTGNLSVLSHVSASFMPEMISQLC